VGALLQSFGRLQAGGATALYDSIVFSLVQLREGAGGGDDRRAVVLLTDGQDYGSRFRPRRVIDDARAQGTPVYVISLAGLYNERGSVRKPDLETIVSHTGGRIYYISDVAELASAYDQINRELRTQYILAFGTERPLTEAELRSIRLRMRRPGLEARVAVEPAR
jgi:VWFA-related protein